jgi:hypothetical protein
VTDRADRRLRRHRLRLPDEYGGRGTPYNLTDLERLLNLALKAQTVLPNILPPGVGVEAEEQDTLTLVVPDKAQIAEMTASFGKVVEALVDKTEKRRIERGLNSLGEKIVEPPSLDAPGRDMLELDEEEPLADDEEWETVTIMVDDDLPEGVYRNEEGEILPIGFSSESHPSQSRRDGLAPQHAVQTIHEVVGIGQSNNPDNREHRARDAQYECSQERNVHRIPVGIANGQEEPHQRMDCQPDLVGDMAEIVEQAHGGNEQPTDDEYERVLPRHQPEDEADKEPRGDIDAYDGQAATERHGSVVRAALVWDIHHAPSHCQAPDEKHGKPRRQRSARGDCKQPGSANHVSFIPWLVSTNQPSSRPLRSLEVRLTKYYSGIRGLASSKRRIFH